MTADEERAAIVEMPVRQGKCRDCGTTRYTTKELNVTDGQDWRCYVCFDNKRWPEGNQNSFVYHSSDAIERPAHRERNGHEGE